MGKNHSKHHVALSEDEFDDIESPAPPPPPETHDEKVARLQKQVDEVKGIALNSMQKVFDRQERMEDIDAKTEEMQMQSIHLKTNSVRLESKKRWQFRKWALVCWIVGCIVFCFVFSGVLSIVAWFLGWIKF